MKIAVFHELHHGGARRAANEIAKELKKDHVVDLYVVDSREDPSDRKYYTKIFFYPFLEKPWLGNNWRDRVYKDTLELFALYRLHRKIAQDINSNTYDAVIIHPSQFTQAPFLLQFIQQSTIYYCQETLRICYEDIFAIPNNIRILKRWYEQYNRFIRKQIDRYNIRRANLILANSQFTGRNIKKAYNLVSRVCYLGVNTSIFRLLALNKDIDILYVGAKDPIDGYAFLEEVIKKISIRIKLEIINQNKERIPDSELVHAYNRSKIVVCFAFDEPFGLIPLEAMSCAVPVVAVKEGGYRESVIHKKTGFLVERNPRKVAEILEWLLVHPHELSKIGRQAREDMVKNWTWKKTAQRVLSLIEANERMV